MAWKVEELDVDMNVDYECSDVKEANSQTSKRNTLRGTESLDS